MLKGLIARAQGVKDSLQGKLDDALKDPMVLKATATIGALMATADGQADDDEITAAVAGAKSVLSSGSFDEAAFEADLIEKIAGLSGAMRRATKRKMIAELKAITDPSKQELLIDVALGIGEASGEEGGDPLDSDEEAVVRELIDLWGLKASDFGL